MGYSFNFSAISCPWHLNSVEFLTVRFQRKSIVLGVSANT